MSDNVSDYIMSEPQKETIIEYMGGHSLFRANKFIGTEGDRNKKDMWNRLTDLVNLCDGPKRTVQQVRDWWTRFKGQAKDYNANKVVFRRLNGNPVEETSLRDKRFERVLEMAGTSHNNGSELAAEMDVPATQIVGVHQPALAAQGPKSCGRQPATSSLQSVMRAISRNSISLQLHSLQLTSPKVSLQPQGLLCNLSIDSVTGLFKLVPKPTSKPVSRTQGGSSCAKAKSIKVEPHTLVTATKGPGHSPLRGIEQPPGPSTCAAAKTQCKADGSKRSFPDNPSGSSCTAAVKRILNVTPDSLLYKALKTSSGKRLCLVPVSAANTFARSSSSTTTTGVPNSGGTFHTHDNEDEGFCSQSTPVNNENQLKASSSSFFHLAPFDVKRNISKKQPSINSTHALRTIDQNVGHHETMYASDLYLGSMAKSAAYTNYGKTYNRKNNLVARTLDSFEQHTAAVWKVSDQMETLIDVNQERNRLLEKLCQEKMHK